MREPWWKTAVFYQIYPRSFQDSNNDGIGDLPGIISRLDYLMELGVTALWISPFFKSPMDDFGYDISDYCDVDPVFGNLEDAKKLIAEAHARGLKLIFDLVINHTSDQHPWFQEARSSLDNPKHDWYIWKPRHDRATGKKLPKPNNWVCQFEFKSAWWDNPQTDEWYLATFTRHQPEVNWRNPELKKAMFDVIRFWLDLGVDGFRMDVVNWFIKDPQFRSNPFTFNANPEIFQKHIYDRNQPETHDICKEIRRIADSYPGDRVLVGEIFSRDPDIAASYQGNGKNQLHLAFNMEMLYLKWDAKRLAQALEHWYRVLPQEGWPNFTLSNHDQPRHASRFADKKGRYFKQRAEIAAMMLLTVRGTPFVYYGEELGMPNTAIPRNELVDPTGITFWPLPLGRDGERTPMQWTRAKNAGFTSDDASPWLRLGDLENGATLEDQKNDERSLWNWYRSLIEIRKTSEALTIGDFAMISPGENDVVSYERTSGTERIRCALNFSPSARTIGFNSQAEVILGNERAAGSILEAGAVCLAPHEALLVRF
ncbi:MAG TPA: alpha-glucosidase [Treponemataceae bacterium]|nr:alpha-glucosidase [Treponemataceae bacterium]